MLSETKWSKINERQSHDGIKKTVETSWFYRRMKWYFRKTNSSEACNINASEHLVRHRTQNPLMHAMPKTKPVTNQHTHKNKYKTFSIPYRWYDAKSRASSTVYSGIIAWKVVVLNGACFNVISSTAFRCRHTSTHI